MNDGRFARLSSAADSVLENTNVCLGLTIQNAGLALKMIIVEGIDIPHFSKVVI